MSASALKSTFRVRDVELDRETHRLKCRWPFDRKEELRALDVGGSRLTEEGQLVVPARNRIRLRELAFKAPATVTFEVRLSRPSSIVELYLAEPGLAQSAVIVSLNRPFRTGPEKARRKDGVVLLEHGKRKPPLVIAPTRLVGDRPAQVSVTVDRTKIEIVVDGGKPVEVSREAFPLFGVSLVAARGGFELGSLSVDGEVSPRSLQKLMRAGISARRDERDDEDDVGAALSGYRAVQSIIRQARGEARTSILDEIGAGRLGPRGPKIGKEKGRKLKTALLTASLARGKARDELAAKAGNQRTAPYPAFLIAQSEPDRGEAARRLRLIVEKVPRFPLAWQALGLIHLERHEDGKALECFETARKQDLSDPWTTALCGFAHLRLSDFRRASSMISAARQKKYDSEALRSLQQYARLLSRGPFGSSGHRRRSDHYVIESNVGRAELAALGEKLERYRLHLERHLPLPVKQETRSRVWVFDSREEYYSYTETLTSRLESSLGVYHPALNTLLLFASLSTTQNEEVLFHEAFHQYLDISVPNAPLWFNEGMAEFFGSTKFGTDGSAVPGLLEGRLATLRAHLDGGHALPGIRELLLMDRTTFMTRNAPLHYAWSWVLVHYFREAAELRVRKLFDVYARAIVGRKGQQGAWTASFAAESEESLSEIEAGARSHLDGLFRRLAREGGAEK